MMNVTLGTARSIVKASKLKWVQLLWEVVSMLNVLLRIYLVCKVSFMGCWCWNGRWVVKFSLWLIRSSLVTAILMTLWDDWLKRDRFVYIGWSGIVLLPSAYFSLGAWFTGTTFVTSWYSHGLASSYIEGCNFVTVSVSTPPNCFGHSLTLAWGAEAQECVVRWFQMGGLWTYLGFHSCVGCVGFNLRQFEIASLVNIRAYNVIAFSGPKSLSQSNLPTEYSPKQQV